MPQKKKQKKKLNVTKLFSELNEEQVLRFFENALEVRNIPAVKAVLAAGVVNPEKRIELLQAYLRISARGWEEDEDFAMLKFIAGVEGVDINGRDGSSPLGRAAQCGNTRAVDFLLSQKDINPNASSRNLLNLPALMASINGHKDILATIQAHPKYDESIFQQALVQDEEFQKRQEKEAAEQKERERLAALKPKPPVVQQPHEILHEYFGVPRSVGGG